MRMPRCTGCRSGGALHLSGFDNFLPWEKTPFFGCEKRVPITFTSPFFVGGIWEWITWGSHFQHLQNMKAVWWVLTGAICDASPTSEMNHWAGCIVGGRVGGTCWGRPGLVEIDVTGKGSRWLGYVKWPCHGEWNGFPHFSPRCSDQLCWLGPLLGQFHTEMIWLWLNELWFVMVYGCVW